MSPRQQAPQLSPTQLLGRDTPRIDAVERVTGTATYTRDLRVPGMLYARLLTSPHAHARIVAIDVSRAAALPGVRAIITHDTQPPSPSLAVIL
jgi:4-hydroxybenzoyl-CoA reductase subunit alpha